jgi:uncharacterized repeat protein (TIGR01451 family)
VGDVITYTYTLTNSGNVTLSGPFTIEDDKATVTVTQPADGMLSPGESTTGAASYTITQADLDAGSVMNTAMGHGFFGETPVDSNEDDETVASVPRPALTLVKSASPATYDSVGDVITYTYTLTNSGNVTLSGPFTIEDDRATVTVTQPADGMLSPGESTAGAASYTITQADLDAGSVMNTAMGHGFFGETPVDSNEDDETVTAEQRPAISVVKTSDAPDGFVAQGTSVQYTFVVTNTGNVTLYNVVVTDDKLGVVGTLEMLAAGASATFTASAVLENTTTNVVVATGEDKNGEEVSDQDTVTVETFAPFTPLDLAIEKTVSNATFEPGDVVTYTLRYQNLDARAATSFTIVDDFDERYVSVLNANGGIVADGKITWTIAGPLTSADGVQLLAYTVRVNADMPTGTTKVGNTVVISHPDDDDLTNNRDEATITVTEEPFLPFTGGDATLLLMVAFLSAATGFFLRRRAV